MDIFCGLLENCVLSVILYKVLELDQYAILTDYSLLNTTKMKFNRTSHICILDIVTSQRYFRVILTCYYHISFRMDSMHIGTQDRFLQSMVWTL